MQPYEFYYMTFRRSRIANATMRRLDIVETKQICFALASARVLRRPGSGSRSIHLISSWMQTPWLCQALARWLRGLCGETFSRRRRPSFRKAKLLCLFARKPSSSKFEVDYAIHIYIYPNTTFRIGEIVMVITSSWLWLRAMKKWVYRSNEILMRGILGLCTSAGLSS